MFLSFFYYFLLSTSVFFSKVRSSWLLFLVSLTFVDPSGRERNDKQQPTVWGLGWLSGNDSSCAARPGESRFRLDRGGRFVSFGLARAVSAVFAAADRTRRARARLRFLAAILLSDRVRHLFSS